VATSPSEAAIRDRLSRITKSELVELAKMASILERKVSAVGPINDDELHDWINAELGIDIPRTAVCDGHVSPFQFIADLYFNRENSVIVMANRGGSKTFGVAVLHYLNGTFKPGIEGFTFGATEAQSKRAYAHLKSLIRKANADNIENSLESKTTWKNGSSLEIVPGCLPKQARIVTEDGPMEIDKIVCGRLPVKVRSYNYDTKSWEWRQVIDWHNQDPVDRWLQAKVKFGPQGVSHVTVTSGHQMMMLDGTKVSLGHLSVGSHLAVEAPILSSEQRQVLMGTLLGDASVSPKGRLRHAQASYRSDYTAWITDAFSEFSPYTYRRQAKNTNDVDFSAVRPFHEAREQWYPQGIKRIPSSTWDELGVLGLACWLMDDGSYVRMDDNGYWTISTHHFNMAERGDAARFFERMGLAVKWVPVNYDRDQYMIRFGHEDSAALTSLVSDHIDVGARQDSGGFKRWRAAPIDKHSALGLVPAEIVKLVEVTRKSRRYDITVEGNHNYLTQCGILVSNTVRAVNGPHPQVVHADEVDLMDESVYDESRNMAASKVLKTHTIPAQNVITSTRKSGHGLMQRIMNEIAEAELQDREPPFKLYAWCIFEVAAPVTNCQVAYPDQNCESCNCHDVIKGSWENGEQRTLKDVCQGRLARSQGWIPKVDVDKLFTSNSQQIWEAQQQCIKPSTEGLVLPQFSRERHCVKAFDLDPANGAIYEGIDFGSTNPHAVLKVQVLDHEIEVESFGGAKKRLRQGSHVFFDEIYKAEAGNAKLADMIIARNKLWRDLAGPGFRISGRFCDPQGKSARLDLRDKGLPSQWYATRDVKEHIKHVSDILSDDLFFVVADRCPMMVEEIESWHYPRKRASMTDDPEIPVADFDHAMSAMRYVTANIARLTSGKRVGGRQAAPGTNGRRHMTSGMIQDVRQSLGTGSRPSPLREGLPESERWRSTFGLEGLK
jgi:hypothetical protein